MKTHGLSWVHNYRALEKGITGETGGIDLWPYPQFSVPGFTNDEKSFEPAKLPGE